ncbi:MAG: hypothetical protein Ct9H90mP30_6160 [Actinomycetota bacterium]|nr:MAG: hypothetical protein Ct9H90mP30_6160 [Actinomycetota bacterium]
MEPHQAVRRSLSLFLLWFLANSIIFAVLLAMIGITILYAVLIAIFLSTTTTVLAYRRMELRIIAKVNAEAIDKGSYPKFENLVEGLCVAHGFRNPNLFIISDSAPNMMMVGKNSPQGNLIVTTGLLERVNRVELERVLITHELSRIRNRLALLDCTTAVLVAKPFVLFPGFEKWLTAKLFASWSVAETDLQAVSLTRYPIALASALSSLNIDGRVPRVIQSSVDTYG